jgi:hypothetical protein
VMDLVVPIAWCCFVLLNQAILQLSVYLLVGLYVGGFLFMLWFYYFVTMTDNPLSKPHNDLTISGRRRPGNESPRIELPQATRREAGPMPQEVGRGGGVMLGAENEDDSDLPHSVSLPVICEGPANNEDVELYFSSDIFSGQQMIVPENDGEYAL